MELTELPQEVLISEAMILELRKCSSSVQEKPANDVSH